MFYWKCQICKEAIKDDLCERFIDGRKVHYHRRCLDKQEYWGKIKQNNKEGV